MKFKEGDRVRVFRLNNSNVDFFTTLRYVNLPGLYQMIDSTDSNYNEHLLRKSNQRNFGPDKDDYYVLAEDEENKRTINDLNTNAYETKLVTEDEEDTEEPVIQHTTDPVNHPDHYNYGEIEVIDFAEQVANQYPPKLAPHVYNAIKYLSRATLKNGQEDIEKAKFSVQRLFDKWE